METQPCSSSTRRAGSRSSTSARQRRSRDTPPTSKRWSPLDVRRSQGTDMRIAIFGATGRTGRHLVDRGLAAGHELWALARNPSKLSAGHQRLTIVPGDVLDGTAVEETVASSEAVLCAIGTPPTRPGRAMSDGTRTIVDAMARSGVQR